MSLPMPFPVVAIWPISATYASSYWGFNVFLCDIAIGTGKSEKQLFNAKRQKAKDKKMDIENLKIAHLTPEQEEKLKNDLNARIKDSEIFEIYIHNFRLFPLSIWAGFPLSSKGSGLYIFGEVAPLNGFLSFTDNYKEFHWGVCLNYGIKYIISKHYEVEFKFENNFDYGKFGLKSDCNYIGLTFKYRFFDFAYLGIWDMEKWW
jgi:hypothetical protein